jgi:hypothetical protein
MISPFQKNPLGGTLGNIGAVFYRLLPNGVTPVAEIVRLVGDHPLSANRNRMTMDIVDSEEWSQEYQATTNALQDFTDAQSNVHRALERATFTGTLVGDQQFAGVFGIRRDLAKVEDIRAIADRLEPVMVISPRVSFAKAFITSISRTWSKDMGETSGVSISIVEARIVNPLAMDALEPDIPGMNTGNNRVTDVGSQAPSPVNPPTQDLTSLADAIAGVAPKFI